MKKSYLFIAFLFSITSVFAQKEITGKVTDNSGAVLSGVSVKEKGTSNGVSTDANGMYKLNIKEGATLVFSYVGFNVLEKRVFSGSVFNVMLTESSGQSLDDVVIVGSRAAPRTNVLSALPVDVLSSKDLNSTGQATFDKALQYKIPSFNTVQTPVNDATSLLDPYEIRNMGPSRTLVLINGKRKNMSSLVYTQTSPGRGETGADISAIPVDAIERVEILRDGASAQYGSDAIAGVMNIILKKDAKTGAVNLRTGITDKGDGAMFGFALNNGTKVGEKGFLNYTVDFSKVNLANRPGTVDAQGEVEAFGANLADVQKFLALYPDAKNINGSPETVAAKFLINGGTDISEHTQLYYNAAYVYKKVNSFANYRTPYWKSLADYPFLKTLYGDGTDASYMGYGPTFVGTLNDYNATLGYKSKVNDWNTDASVTIGGNQQLYTVGNSVNLFKNSSGTFTYGADSPITFKPGGTKFDHLVGNIDISRVLSDKVSIGFGAEFRTENFEIIAGDKASYDGSGADSFQGNTLEQSGKFNRYNLGGYFDISYDVTKDWLINGTARYENYSDFGSANVWKISSRYKLADDKMNLRASLSTGFRAPSLHQIYTEKAQSTFGSGGIEITGIVNNVSTAARLYGVPKLTPEKSTNITFGLGLKPTSNFNMTIDYYNIGVKDRIVLGEKINYGTNKVAFFVNAIDTRTEGIDFVAGYKNIVLGRGKLALNLSGNYTITNERVGDIRNPASVAAVGQTVFTPTQDALMFTSRPKFKGILGGDYAVGKWIFSLNNTAFGPTKFKNADFSNPGLGIEFATKVVTDLGVNYNITKKLTVTANVNNLFDILPTFKVVSDGSASADAIVNNPTLLRQQVNLITFSGRYSQMSYDGFQFSQLGRMYNLALSYKF